MELIYYKVDVGGKQTVKNFVVEYNIDRLIHDAQAGSGHQAAMIDLRRSSTLSRPEVGMTEHHIDRESVAVL